MKRIEDIEKLSPEELEGQSQGIEVPEGFARRLEDTLLAASAARTAAARPEAARTEASRTGAAMRPQSRRTTRWIGATSLAAAAAIAAILLLQRPGAPKDSFDDPLIAYACVEDTFKYISTKMSGGIDIVRQAENAASKPEEIISKINGK